MKKTEIWLRNYDAVYSFGMEKGHIDIPSDTPEHRRVKKWWQSQVNRTNIPDYQAEKIDFLMKRFNVVRRTKAEKDWDDWKRNFEILTEYVFSHGHHSVSIKEDKRLHYWVMRQRKAYKEERLSLVKIEKLLAIDFVFAEVHQKKTYTTNKNEETWNKMYSQFKEFVHEHGHGRVPAKYEKNMQLGYWVAKQRAVKKSGRMRPDRSAKLDEVGFAWVVPVGR